MACKKGMPGGSRTLGGKIYDFILVPTTAIVAIVPTAAPHTFQRYFQWIKFLNSHSSASRSRTRATGRCAWTAASRLGDYRLCPMIMGYADISMAHLTVRGETLRLPVQKGRAYRLTT
jgi:hypothetical protein